MSYLTFVFGFRLESNGDEDMESRTISLETEGATNFMDFFHLLPSRDVTSSTPTASVVAHMPVWPPNRQVWPPPRTVCTRGRVGAERVRFGKCDSPTECAAQQEGESPRMSWCVTWTSLRRFSAPGS